MAEDLVNGGGRRWLARGVRAGILIAWAGFLWATAARSGAFRSQALSLGALGSEREPGVEWSGLYYKGSKIGYAYTERTRSGDGWDLRERSYMKVQVLGEPREVTTSGEAVLDGAHNLQRFTFWLKSGPNALDLAGRMEARRLHLTLRSGGQTRDQVLAVPEGIHLPMDLGEVLTTRPLRKGVRFRVPLFDPMTLTQAPMEIEVEGEEERTEGGKTRLVVKLREDLKGMESYAWITPDGEVLMEESPQTGFSSRRESKEEALGKGWPSPSKAPDLIASTAVPVTEGRDRLRRPRSLERMEVDLLDVDPTRLHLSGPRQRARGPFVTVRREEIPSGPVALSTLARDPRLAEDLAPTPFLQSDDPRIRAAARNAARGSNDAVTVVRRLARWVFEALRPAPTVAMPTASEVLRAGQGDCKSHAVLFVAMARSLGIPARVAAGIVYLPEGAAGSGYFYYHAWAEVYLGSWISVDPTFDQFPADATHLRLVERGVENWMDLIRVIGRLKIQVVDAG